MDRSFGYIVNFGNTLHFKEILHEKMRNTDCYAILCYESSNDMTQNCQIDIWVKMFNPVEDRV